MTGDPHDQITRLEERIEALADSAERCRKIILFSRIVIGIGLVLLPAVMFGVVDRAAMVGAIAAVIGGIVAFGSNTSTLNRIMADIAAAEALRNELIGRIDLRPVEAPLHQ
jgi:hypothetical protein